MNWSVADHIRGLESRRVGIAESGSVPLPTTAPATLGRSANCGSARTRRQAAAPKEPCSGAPALTGSFDAYTNLPDGTTTTGVLLFARTDAQIAAEPLMRLAWNDVTTNKQTYIWFAFALKGQLPISCAAPHPAKRWWPHR